MVNMVAKMKKALFNILYKCTSFCRSIGLRDYCFFHALLVCILSFFLVFIPFIELIMTRDLTADILSDKITNQMLTAITESFVLLLGGYAWIRLMQASVGILGHEEENMRRVEVIKKKVKTILGVKTEADN